MSGDSTLDRYRDAIKAKHGELKEEMESVISRVMLYNKMKDVFPV